MARKLATLTPHQRAEEELTAYGLSFPETTSGPAWPPARGLYVRKKMFCVFGAKGEPLNALTLLMKLPISAERRKVAVRAAGARLVQAAQLGDGALRRGRLGPPHACARSPRILVSLKWMRLTPAEIWAPPQITTRLHTDAGFL